MKRIIDVDMTARCKKVETAFNRFFKKYPELEYWRENFEWMAENNVDFDCNNMYNDGSRNNDWTFALHLDIYEDYCYIAVIERAYTNNPPRPGKAGRKEKKRCII